MPYTGKFLQARDACSLVAPHFPNSKVKALATMSGESSFNVGAWHDNTATFAATDRWKMSETGDLQQLHPRAVKADGEVTSRDCGLFQINIPGRLIGTETEEELRTGSSDPDVYLPVAKANVDAAYALYVAPWIRDGKTDIRRWQPWVAYTTGWAMFGEAWVWRHVEGEPVGPWVATGRHLHKAIRGVANWHLLIAGDMNSTEALQEARRLAVAFGAKGTLAYDEKQHVFWKYPDKPTLAPADRHGPRPVPNDGI